MPLNVQKGNMYGFVTHTWNTVKGVCPHQCTYCYMKRFKQNPVRFDEKELDTNHKKNRVIFVGSSCDMWAKDIDSLWIKKTVIHCAKYPLNTYLFQSKNPGRFLEMTNYAKPPDMVLATTIETHSSDLAGRYSKAPSIETRAQALAVAKATFNCKTMVTIEPILDLDPYKVVELLQAISPDQVNIGADSKDCGLIEPTTETLYKLIGLIEGSGIKLVLKKNLKRIIDFNKITTEVL